MNTPAQHVSRSRPRAGRWLSVSVVLVVVGIGLGAVALRGPAPPRTLDERVHDIAVTLRCPVCQNLSVADSPSALAQEMRARIGRELQAGRSAGQIRDGFVQAYGEWILLSPPGRGVDIAAWILPPLVTLTGLLIMALGVCRWAARGRGRSQALDRGVPVAGSVREGSTLSEDERSLLDRAVAAEDPG